MNRLIQWRQFWLVHSDPQVCYLYTSSPPEVSGGALPLFLFEPLGKINIWKKKLERKVEQNVNFIKCLYRCSEIKISQTNQNEHKPCGQACASVNEQHRTTVNVPQLWNSVAYVIFYYNSISSSGCWICLPVLKAPSAGRCINFPLGFLFLALNLHYYVTLMLNVSNISIYRCIFIFKNKRQYFNRQHFTPWTKLHVHIEKKTNQNCWYRCFM